MTTATNPVCFIVTHLFINRESILTRKCVSMEATIDFFFVGGTASHGLMNVHNPCLFFPMDTFLSAASTLVGLIYQ